MKKNNNEIFNEVKEQQYGNDILRYNLRIFEYSHGLRGDLYVYANNKWVLLSRAKFCEKDGDATVYRVREYFNFFS